MAGRDRPNILVLFTDQQRWDTIAALGNPIIRTPSLDRLVAEGTAFTSAYSPSPVCVPARACMHYGQYPHRTGCYNNTTPMPDDGRPSFMELLTRAGYRTHAVGKCHFKPDPQALRGFQGRERQEEIVPRIKDDDYLLFLREAGFDHVRDPHGARSEMVYMPQVSQLPARGHPSQWVGDRSIRFIEEQAGGNQPWLLFASFIHPHPPYAPPSPWDKLYRAVRMPPPHLPDGYASLQPFVSRSRLGHYYHDGPIHVNLWRTIRAFYYACVSFVDFQVGRILEALERTGRLDDTLVVFTSDHGDMLGDYGLVGKSCMLDAAARIPLVVRRPGAFDVAARCDRVASLLDVGRTLLRAAGVEPPADWAGVDLADLAAGKADRATVFSQVNQAAVASYMAVDERWKYVYSTPDRRECLFDRRDDPHETRDLGAAGAGGDELRRLKAALIEHLRAGGEDAALDGDDWKAYPLGEIPDPETHRNIRDNPWADYRVPGYSDREGS